MNNLLDDPVTDIRFRRGQMKVLVGTETWGGGKAHVFAFDALK